MRRAALASVLLLSLVPALGPDAGLPGRVALVDASALSVTVTPTVVPVTGGSVILTGDDFGDSKSAFGKSGWTAKVDGKAAKLAWVSSTSLQLAVPPGKIGIAPSIVVSRGTDSTDPDTTSVQYGAGITAAKATVDATGPVLKLSGAGLADSDGWQFTPETEGGSSIELPVGGDPASVGVVIGSDTSATVRLPAAPGAAGAYRLAFTPAGGAPFAPSDAARYVYKVPTLTGTSVAAISAAGGSFSIKGTGLSAVDASDAAAVTLTSTADPTVSVGLSVTPVSDTQLTVTAPAAPTGADGAPAAGAYTLSVTTPLGAATSKGGITVAYVAPLVVTVPDGTSVPATGGSLLVNGTGFGTSKKSFTDAKIAATVGGKKAAAAWVSDTQLAVTVPPGDPGKSATVTVTRRDVASAPLQVPYMAAIAKLSASTGPAAGGYVLTVNGKGFKGASTWSLTDDAGEVVTALPVVTSLDGVDAGVKIADDTKATVRMPASDKPFRTVVLTVGPDQTVYPGSGYLATSKAVFTYSNAG